MRVELWDINTEVVFAWTQTFTPEDEVRIGSGSILQARVDAVVSPANSYGIMDGGIDLAYRNFFGIEIERRVRAFVAKKFAGEIPVGMAFVVHTGHARIARLVVAPTMKTPRIIAGTNNVFEATRAALLAADTAGIEKLGFPGMGTGVGRMDPFESAEQVRRAIVDWRTMDGVFWKTLRERKKSAANKKD